MCVDCQQMNQAEIDAIASRITQRWINLRGSRQGNSSGDLSRVSLANLQHPFLSTLSRLAEEIYRYEDRELLDSAMDVIPMAELFDKAEAALPSYSTLALDDVLVMELAKWFKGSFMKWVNVVPCQSCPDGGKTHSIENGLVTDQERLDGAGRVEMSECDICGTKSRFPRYGSVRKLLTTRRGRCGEWAALFTLFLRAIGQRARCIWNSEDHVWNECYSEHLKRWVHVDSCEAAYDKAAIYERGWGKKMRYCIAFSTDGVKDVTRRYVTSSDGALPRDSISESALATWISNRTSQMRQGLDEEKLLEEDALEEAELVSAKNRAVKADEMQGRQSGSLEWRSSRKETGQAVELSEVEVLYELEKAPELMSLNGMAKNGPTSGIILTEALPDQTSSMYCTKLITTSESFTSTFSFRLLKSPGAEQGADGFAFVIQRDIAGPQAIGEGGCGLGYAGLRHAVVVEFDTYQTWDRCEEPPAPHVAIHIPPKGGKVSSHHRQAIATAGNDTVPPFNDGRIYHGKVSYAAKTMYIYLDEGDIEQTRNWTLILKASIDLEEAVGQSAYFGFSAATGGIAQRHEILSWTIKRAIIKSS